MIITRLTGDKELDRAFRRMPQAVQNKIEAQAIRAGLSRTVTSIRRQFPPKYAHLRHTVKQRFRRRDRRTKGMVAKAGPGVGRQLPARRSGRNKGGVGLGGKNIHWGVLGTGVRLTKTGQYRGMMPPILGGVVERGWSAAEGEVTRAIVDRLTQGIEREWKRSSGRSFAMPLS